MALIVRNDVILPATLMEAAGLQGKNQRNNQRTRAPNGQQAVNVRQGRTARQYQFGTVPLRREQWQTFEGAYEVTDAGAYGMLMVDPKDAKASVGEGLLYPYTTALVGTIGLGYGVPAFKLHKRYTSIGSTRTSDRKITRPRATPALLRAGSPVTLGASPGDAAIDYDTGTVTFVADTSQAPTSITVGATTTLVFPNNTGMYAALAVGQRAYVSGVTGTAGAVLNGLSHVVASKSGNSVVLSTSTAGLAVTLPGTAYKYPQASEAMTWSGRFYVPVHFANDDLNWNLAAAGLEDARYFIGPSTVLEEILE